MAGGTRLKNTMLAVCLGIAAGLALGGVQYRLLRRMLPRTGARPEFWTLPAKLALWALGLILGLTMAGPVFTLALAGSATTVYIVLGAIQSFRSR